MRSIPSFGLPSGLRSGARGGFNRRFTEELRLVSPGLARHPKLAMLWDASTGLMLPARGRGALLAPTFARTTTKTYVDIGSGYMVNPGAAIDAPAFEVMPGGSVGLKVDPSRTNSLKWSRALSTSPWVVTGISSINQDAVGVDGVANTAWTLTDSDAAASKQIYQLVAVPNDSNPLCFSFLVKKDADEARFPAIQVNLSGGTAVYGLVRLDTKTGATGVGSTYVPTAYGAYSYNRDYWRLWMIITNNGSGNTNAYCYAKPADSDVLNGGGTVNSAVGSAVFDCGQVELNALYPSAPIITAASAVLRTADTLTFPHVVEPTNHAVLVDLVPMQGLVNDVAAWRFVTFNDAAGALQTARQYGSTVYSISPQVVGLPGGGYGFNVKMSDFFTTSLNRYIQHAYQNGDKIRGRAVMNGIEQYNADSVADRYLAGMGTTTSIGNYLGSVFCGWIKKVAVFNGLTADEFAVLARGRRV